MRRAYDILLRLYPRDYRARFAAEMLATFEEAAEGRRGHGWAVVVRFAIAELFSLLTGVAIEWVGNCAYVVYRSANLIRPFSLVADWIANFTLAIGHFNHSFRGRCAPDLRMMRPPGVSWESFYGARPQRTTPKPA
jgi:hypothetical protein